MNRLRITVLIAATMMGSLLFAAEPAPTASSTEASSKEGTAATKDQKPAQPAAKADAPPAKAADPKGTGKSAETQAAKNAASGEDEEHAPAPSAANKGPSPQRFTPSEQVRADFDVSFPIDI